MIRRSFRKILRVKQFRHVLMHAYYAYCILYCFSPFQYSPFPFDLIILTWQPTDSKNQSLLTSYNAIRYVSSFNYTRPPSRQKIARGAKQWPIRSSSVANESLRGAAPRAPPERDNGAHTGAFGAAPKKVKRRRT